MRLQLRIEGQRAERRQLHERPAGNAAFGTIRARGTPRQMQFAVKLCSSAGIASISGAHGVAWAAAIFMRLLSLARNNRPRQAARHGAGAAAQPAVVEVGRRVSAASAGRSGGRDRGKPLQRQLRFATAPTHGVGIAAQASLRSQLCKTIRTGRPPIVQDGRPPRMPKFDFSPSQVADIAVFLHSFTINSRDPARIRPESIVTGDAAAGQAYFTAKCASCHSITADLKGLAARFPDSRALQQWWLMPGGGGRDGGANRCPAAADDSHDYVRNYPTFEGHLVRSTSSRWS